METSQPCRSRAPCWGTSCSGTGGKEAGVSDKPQMEGEQGKGDPGARQHGLLLCRAAPAAKKASLAPLQHGADELPLAPSRQLFKNAPPKEGRARLESITCWLVKSLRD